MIGARGASMSKHERSECLARAEGEPRASAREPCPGSSFPTSPPGTSTPGRASGRAKRSRADHRSARECLDQRPVKLVDDSGELAPAAVLLDPLARRGGALGIIGEETREHRGEICDVVFAEGHAVDPGL